MQKLKRLILPVVLLLVAGILLMSLKSDYHGEIGNLSQSKFILFPLKVNPEEEPFTPEVYFSNDTEVTGITWLGGSAEELYNGMIVKVWVSEKNGKEYARKIKVINR